MRPGINRLSLTTVPIEVFAGSTPCGRGTGFFYNRTASSVRLVTNWHVVTAGRDPRDPSKSPTGAVPTEMRIRVHPLSAPGEIRLSQTREVRLPLNDPDGEAPRWLEHPVHANRVDVVVLELGVQELDQTAFFTVSDDAQDFVDGYMPEVMDDAFVVGYPRGLTGGSLALPLFKRATVASEPRVDVDGLPQFLVDGATVEGMSGAPVVCAHRGNLWNPSGQVGADSIIGRTENMVGVYSGRRYGQHGDVSSIGIVWKRSALDEVVDGRAPGTPLSAFTKRQP